MTAPHLLRTGAIATAMMLVCCAKLALAVGTAGLAVWLDRLLVPGLVAVLAAAGYGLYRQRHRGAQIGCALPSTDKTQHAKEQTP